MKVLVLKQNITDQETITKGLQLYVQQCASIGLPIEITEQDFTKKVTSISNKNGGYEVNPSDITGVWDIGYDALCFIFDATKIAPMPTNPVDDGPVMQIPIQWFANNPQVLADYLEHETDHMKFSQTGKKDITHLIYDRNMDPQLYDSFGIGQKQPREWYLYLLKDLIKENNPTGPAHNDPSYKYDTLTGKPNPNYIEPLQTVTITRSVDDGVQTFGDLSVGSFSCKTLELPWKGNQVNISCIPKGTYHCTYNMSLSHLGWTYSLTKVQGRSGIRIHSANYYTDLEGCIGLGSDYKRLNGDSEVDIINSKVTVKAFEAYMQKKDFTLIIK